MKKEILIVGQGRQGIRLMGDIFLKALTLSGREALTVPSYGAEVSGGNSVSQLVVSDEPIDFPGVLEPDILIAMSQEGYDAWVSRMSLESQTFFDIDMVKSILTAKSNHIPVPATRIATELGSRQSANMVMLGQVVGVTQLVSLEDLFEIIKKETGRFADVNLEALKEGYKLSKRCLVSRPQN